MIEELPFPVQAIQTDRGREFFAYCFQEKLMEYAIKFRPIKPASPHLNGKVERSQRTDLDEFYPSVDLRSPDLQRRLEEWQDHYNQFRPHGSLHGRTPWEAWLERLALTPFQDEVESNYDDAAERIRHPEYQMDLKLAMQNKEKSLLEFGGAAPKPPRFYAFAPEWLIFLGRLTCRPAIPAAESALELRLRRALSSAQVPTILLRVFVR